MHLPAVVIHQDQLDCVARRAGPRRSQRSAHPTPRMPVKRSGRVVGRRQSSVSSSGQARQSCGLSRFCRHPKMSDPITTCPDKPQDATKATKGVIPCGLVQSEPTTTGRRSQWQERRDDPPRQDTQGMESRSSISAVASSTTSTCDFIGGCDDISRSSIPDGVRPSPNGSPRSGGQYVGWKKCLTTWRAILRPIRLPSCIEWRQCSPAQTRASSISRVMAFRL